MAAEGMVHIYESVTWPQVAYADRLDAGRKLTDWITPEPDPQALVLALPRGGVPVGVAVAEALGCGIRPVLVRKLPIPWSPEMGFGAVTVDGTVTLNETVVEAYGIGTQMVAEVAEKTLAEVVRRSKAYPGGWPLPDLKDRRVWLVDDGLATGFSAVAAARMIRGLGAARVTVAVPCGPHSSAMRLAEECDAVWCRIAQGGGGSFAVASYYRDFHDMSDDEVVRILRRWQGAGNETGTAR